jgi:hypothetical protein
LARFNLKIILFGGKFLAGIFIPKTEKKKKKMDYFLTFLHPILPKYSERKFNALFGIQVKTAFSLWEYFPTIDPLHLFQTLYFLKNYPSMDSAAVFWRIDPKTFSKHCWDTLHFLHENLHTVYLFLYWPHLIKF